MSKRLTIGLFGFGVVGQGLHDIISTKDLNIEIRKIAIKNPDKVTFSIKVIEILTDKKMLFRF